MIDRRNDDDGVLADSVPDDVWVPPDQVAPAVGRGRGIRIGWSAGDALAGVETPDDPSLPQLAAMLDGARMGRIFQDKLPGGFAEGRLRIERCRVAFVRYSPLRSCTVGYYLGVGERASGRCGTQLVCAKVSAETPSEQFLRRHLRELKIAPQFGLPFAYLAEERIVVAAYPNDLRIGRLDRMLDPSKLRRLLRAALRSPTLKLTSARNAAAPVRVISYKPERSCLVRCTLRPSNLDSDLPDIVFARMYHNERGEHVYRGMLDLWQYRSQHHGGKLSVARPLAYDHEKKLLVQGAVAGAPMTNLIHDERFIDCAGMAARSLVAIHRTPTKVTRERCNQRSLQSHTGAAKAIRRIDADVGESLGKLIHLLQDSLPAPTDSETDLVHGDFSLNQLMVDAESLSIIDFDQVGVGDGYADIGTFLARLDKQVFEGRIPVAQARRAAAAFRRSYEAESGTPLADERVNWYMALAMTGMVLSTRKNLKPGWRSRVDYCSSRAEALLAEAG
jgi:aminoglycoside phosphotransferase